jgi:hypothetical protein
MRRVPTNRDGDHLMARKPKQKCQNGHDANSDGNCSTKDCVAYMGKRNKGYDGPTPQTTCGECYQLRGAHSPVCSQG